jgi:hypothetical protein
MLFFDVVIRVMTINDQIFVNQLAQGLADLQSGRDWFLSHSESGKRAILLDVNFMIANTGPRIEEIVAAIEKSRLKPGATSCVMLGSGEVRTQMAKLTALPERDLTDAFTLLVSLLGVSDARRRREKALDAVNHWWHRDLRDSSVVAEIRREHGAEEDFKVSKDHHKT